MLRSMAQVGLNDIPGATATLAAAEKAAPGNLEVHADLRHDWRLH